MGFFKSTFVQFNLSGERYNHLFYLKSNMNGKFRNKEYIEICSSESIHHD